MCKIFTYIYIYIYIYIYLVYIIHLYHISIVIFFIFFMYRFYLWSIMYIYIYICINIYTYIYVYVQYVGKSKTRFHIRSNKHRKDIKNPNAIKLSKHFKNWNHVFCTHGKFILIEQLNNIKNTSTEVLKQRLKDRENYWLKRLKTLIPFGSNQELN